MYIKTTKPIKNEHPLTIIDGVHYYQLFPERPLTDGEELFDPNDLRLLQLSRQPITDKQRIADLESIIADMIGGAL